MASAKIQRMSKSGKQKQAQKSQNNDIPDEIQCKICKKRYEDPKLLPCLHTYCKACLEQSVQTHNGAIYCPVCPTEIASLEFSGVDNLQSNFMVSNLLQAIDLKQGLSSKQCESCEEGETATSRCFECSDFLCGNCVEAHKRVRFTKNHRVVAIKNLNADAMVKSPTCAIHIQEALKMFCKQCKKPVCRSCILSEHNEHMLISLKEAVDDTKPKINALLVATRAKIPILQRKLKGVHASKEKLELERKEQALKDDLTQVLQSCNLSEREDHAVPETAESEIKYRLEEKPVLDTLKKCLQFMPTDFPELDGTFPCGIKQCKTCSFIDSGTVISTKKSEFSIRHHFTCKSFNLVYCISCSKCDLLYIGETERCLQTKFDEHRRSVEKPKKHERNYGVVEHFTSKGHNSSHMKVRALLPCPDKDETHPEQEETSPEQEEKRRKQEETRRKQEETRRKQEEKRRKQEEKRRKQEETRLIVELGTLYPSGLNKTL